MRGRQNERARTRKVIASVDAEQKRLERNKKARERHWRKTGVSASTVEWMDRNGIL